MKTIALIGRANVGKSTLFNALVNRRSSIVEDIPGVTRDRVYGVVRRGGDPFAVVDTGGITDEVAGELDAKVREQVELALLESDLLVVMLDCMQGVHPLDAEVVELVRRATKPVLWVINKCERAGSDIEAAEFYSLGIQEPVLISATHRQGVRQLVKRVRETLGLRAEEEREANTRASRRAEAQDLAEEAAELLKIAEAQGEDFIPEVPEVEIPNVTVALVGRPNVGKSSLMNRILGNDQVVVSEMPGTTRDSVHIDLVRDGRSFTLIDTAGLRKKARVADGSVERYSTLRTLRALAQADVALVVLDATEGGPPEQEAKIARLVHDRGKGLVIVVNKWDAVEKDHTSVHSYTETIYRTMPFAKYAPILFVSALQGRRCPSILKVAAEVSDGRRVRLATSQVHRIFDRAFLDKPPPVYRGSPVKLLYATQVESSPPTFVLFVNTLARLKPSYERYLERMVRRSHPFTGSALRIVLRKRTSKEEGNGQRAANA